MNSTCNAQLNSIVKTILMQRFQFPPGLIKTCLLILTWVVIVIFFADTAGKWWGGVEMKENLSRFTVDRSLYRHEITGEGVWGGG